MVSGLSLYLLVLLVFNFGSHTVGCVSLFFFFFFLRSCFPPCHCWSPFCWILSNLLSAGYLSLRHSLTAFVFPVLSWCVRSFGLPVPLVALSFALISRQYFVLLLRVECVFLITHFRELPLWKIKWLLALESSWVILDHWLACDFWASRQAGFGRSGVCAAVLAIHKYDLPGELPGIKWTSGAGGDGIVWRLIGWLADWF